MPYSCNGCGRVFEPTGPTVGLFCSTCRPITAETVTDDDIKQAIAVLDTELGILHAARCLDEVLEARAAKESR